MAGERPTGGLVAFLARGGATLMGDGTDLARKVRAHARSARDTMPAAAAFLSRGAVALLPEGTVPEASRALRTAVAVGMAAITVCTVGSDGALASPRVPPAAAPAMASVGAQAAMAGGLADQRLGPGEADAIIAARQRARDIVSAFTPLSQRMAEELHPDLLRVLALARKRSGIAFEIVPGTGGKRTLEMQRQLVARGASKTMTSRHTTGLALDIVPMHSFGGFSAPNFFDKTTFYAVDKAMREAAAELGVPITSGLDFKGFVDLGHFELEKHHYAAYALGAPGTVSLARAMPSDGPAVASAARQGVPVGNVARGGEVRPSTPAMRVASVETPGSGRGSAATPSPTTMAAAATETPRAGRPGPVGVVVASARPPVTDAGEALRGSLHDTPHGEGREHLADLGPRGP